MCPINQSQARHHGRAFRNRAPQVTASAPQTRNLPPKRGLCPKESNRFGANGVQFGAWDPLNTDNQPSICGQEPLFCRFCDEDLFFLFFFFGLHLRICRILCIFLEEDLFFLVFTLEFEGKLFLCPFKNYLCLPVTLLWRRAWSKYDKKFTHF